MTEEADSLPALQDELRYLLDRWDPIGVYDELTSFPPDEYDCLLGPCRPGTPAATTGASLSEYLRHEVQDHFELDPVLYGTDGLADDLDACYAARNQTS